MMTSTGPVTAREAGLAYARARRERNRARFDALYPPLARCAACGQVLLPEAPGKGI